MPATKPKKNIEGRTDLYSVRNSSIQGKGVFAKKRIRKGTRLIEYRGERIPVGEADERYEDDENKTHHHTFLFSVDERTVIDAAVNGNNARWINHSCDPNCEAVEEEGRIWIEAKKNIQPGQELSYNYQLDREGRFEKKFWQLYECRCGASNCRKIMLARPKPPKRKKTTKNRVVKKK
ncbi:SET domain-containing protein-lysine N-methyltransferase [bacterium]|nr:SET domain-containing protein-lysine N-methyltransferase [bacterium]MBU1637933.1 SET domain-containing protein-lysine N-methyltransferase [bacterium]